MLGASAALSPRFNIQPNILATVVTTEQNNPQAEYDQS